VVQEENAVLVMTSVTNVVNEDILQGIANTEEEEVLVVLVEEDIVLVVVVVVVLDLEAVVQERRDLDQEVAQEAPRREEVVLDLEAQRNLERVEVKAAVKVLRRKILGAAQPNSAFLCP